MYYHDLWRENQVTNAKRRQSQSQVILSFQGIDQSSSLNLHQTKIFRNCLETTRTLNITFSIFKHPLASVFEKYSSSRPTPPSDSLSLCQRICTFITYYRNSCIKCFAKLSDRWYLQMIAKLSRHCLSSN